MMTLPVDPIKGSGDMWKDVWEELSDKLSDSKMGEIAKHLKKLGKDVVEKIKNFMIKTFGTTTPEMSKENLKKFVDALQLGKLFEDLMVSTGIAKRVPKNQEQGDEYFDLAVSGMSRREEERHLKDNEELAVKICHHLREVLGVNLYFGFGLPIAFAMSAIGFSTLASALPVVISVGLYYLFTEFMEIHGYENYDGDVAGTLGVYRPEKDMRNK